MERLGLRLLLLRPKVEQITRKDYWDYLVVKKLMESNDGRYTALSNEGGYYFSIDERRKPAIVIGAYAYFEGKPHVHNAIVLTPGNDAKLVYSTKSNSYTWKLASGDQNTKEMMHGNFGLLRTADPHSPKKPWRGGYPDLDEILGAAFPNK